MATNWLFVIVLYHLGLVSHLHSLLTPDCRQGRISFIAGPVDVNIPCGIHKENISFHCEYRGTTTRPQWLINSTLQSSVSSELPPDYYYDERSLIVSNIYSKNNTSYQCQLLVHEEDEICAYRSTIGQLIILCKALPILFNLHCSPFYSLTTHYLDRLKTTFSQVSNFDTMAIYTITYSDSVSGNTCNSTNIPASSCLNEVCEDIFSISSSLCPNFTDISMTVSFTNDSHKNLIVSDPIKIDAENKFVGVSITMSESRIKINCTFLDQPKETMKSCTVRYGPSCQDLSLVPTKASVVNSNSVVVEKNYTQNFSNDIATGADTDICKGGG